MGESEGRPSARDDFYSYVNHAWLTNPEVVIPDEYPRWGSFIQLVDDSLKAQIGLLEEVAAKQNKTADEEKLANIWKVSLQRFEDWAAGKKDLSPIEKELGVLAEHFEQEKVAEYFARAQEIGVEYPFTFDKECNLESSDDVVLDLGSSGLSLPSRDHYLDDKFSEQREWFLAHLGNIEKLVGNLTDDFAAKVVRFETKLAMISMKKDQSRQYDQYFSISSLDKLASEMDKLKFLEEKLANYESNNAQEDVDILNEKSVAWTDEDKSTCDTFLSKMFEKLGLLKVLESNFAANYPGGDEAAKFRVMCFDGDYLVRVFKLLMRESNKADLLAYMQYKVVTSGSGFCSEELNDEVFDFYSRKLRGQKSQKPPKKRTVAIVNQWVGELLGKIYVQKFFSNDDKITVQNMIGDVTAVMGESLKRNDWLTESTKEAALVKLGKFGMKIGFPDKWKDYSELQLSENDSLFEMQQKVTAFEFKTELLRKVNSKKDKTEWHMTPQTVNAYYTPLQNEIVFPAAIIQPPFFATTVDQIDFELDEEEKAVDDKWILDAVNSGGIGAVIAHEITHGFDDQGKKFNGDGIMQNWWTDEDVELFTQKTKVMDRQAEQWTFEAKSDGDSKETKVHRMNGDLTRGENLADMGGLGLSCQALRKRLADANVSEDTQRVVLKVFFKSWANIWRSKETGEFTINQLATDPHAPCSFRGNLVQNIAQFYEVFDIKEGDGMYLKPEDRLEMW
mmetsp:Transcript_15197/g.27068  ORF Transcript_15197/g.27068 Transcript_15197/m.27068 type:complete len:732 (+) Transcript_15197:123-2318(+)